MTERFPVFDAAEHQARVDRLQAAMAARGQDALLLTMPADIFYVTGFLTRFWDSPTRPWFVLVPATGDPVAVIPAIGHDLMRRTWAGEIRTWDAPHPHDDGLSLLSDSICAMVPEGGVLAVPMGRETWLRMPLSGYFAVIERIAPRRIRDGTDTVQRVREIKSAAEIEQIAQVCAVAGRAFDRMPAIAVAGKPLDAVARDFQVAALEEGADWVAYLATRAGPGGYGDVISPAETRPLETGDVLLLDTGAVRNGYYCDFDRNFAIGRASDGVRRAHGVLYGATSDALAALRPGMRACDAHRLLAEGIERRGMTPLGGRLGHGLGISLTEWPSLLPWDETVLHENMVLTLEPGVEVSAGRILVQEEVFVLGAEGARLLSPRGPADLPVLGD
ncbi:peptidase M24 [Zhengella mangrovi]|uniref:Peptidase M24 n=1 Tax=Zhengella mangrovi TaxID=1982044 RepID=A0A2G1QMH2_9HYPH|nr:Xaa-Pro peptidase family protein [Zhengella mangrovi]PHP66674.1 peptidase M24 [Zhengella mangrovi]